MKEQRQQALLVWRLLNWSAMPSFSLRRSRRIRCIRFSSISTLATALAGVLVCAKANGAGLYRDGASARSMAMGGTATAIADDPADALYSNPATLSAIRGPTLELSAGGGFVHGEFSNSANNGNTLNDAGALGSMAIAAPAGPLRFALGVNPDISARARWRYRDAPGGADGATSYGVVPQESGILLLRTSFGVSWQATSTLSLGASVGLLYNKNSLNAPYVFQSQPILRTAKTTLDLETAGYGWNVEGGFLWKPISSLSLGASYTTRSRIVSDGRASGNADTQFANLGVGSARPDFAYDASVINVFPQQVSAGMGWQAMPKLLLSAQMDWINWANSFNTLRVRLKNGNNHDLNGLLGSTSLNDDAPLDWSDQFVWRLGVEYALNPHWTLRAGYSYANNPVPASTLTPLTAAITEHTLTAGVGFHTGPVKIDLAYQWSLPNVLRVGQSALASGEYSNSSVLVTEQWVGLTTTIEF